MTTILVRLVSSPVTIDPDGFRLPLVARIGISHASVIGDSLVGLPEDWCLSLCVGVVDEGGFDLLDSDPETYKTVLQGEPDLDQDAFTAMLSQSANERRWTQAHLDWLAARIAERGGDADDLDPDLPIYLLLGRLTELLDSSAADLLLLKAA